MSWLFSSNLTLLERSLDAAALRNKAISNNIANVDTPGYKRSYVTFEETLQQALSSETLPTRKTHEKHLDLETASASQVRPQMHTDRSTSLRNDGNNVDIDVEMTNLAINQLQYNALVQRINGQFSKLKYAISEGKR
jgi:flagellar basal-body rod protein FlgB